MTLLGLDLSAEGTGERSRELVAHLSPWSWR
jgi:hypothetical protein